MRYIRVITALFTITTWPAFAQHPVTNTTVAAPPKPTGCTILSNAEHEWLLAQITENLAKGDKIDQLSGDNTAASQQIADLQKAITAQNENTKALESKLAAGSQVVSAKDAEIGGLQTKVTELSKGVGDLRNQLMAEQQKNRPTSPESN